MTERPLIYEPTGRAREYVENADGSRDLACNPWTGCEHGCLYCYAKRWGERPLELRRDFFRRLRAKAQQLQGSGRRVLLCFLTDPYQPHDRATQFTRQTILILQEHGLHVTVLTKGGMRAVRDFDLLGRGDQFAATLTFTRWEDSRHWEPKAATPDERLKALRLAHRQGIETWVSLEPILDPAQTVALIEASHGYVGEFRVGKLNYVHLGIDWRRCAESVLETLQRHGCPWYIKQDLLKFMPPGTPQRSPGRAREKVRA